MYSAHELKKIISAASFLLSCCFSEVQILYSYRSVGPAIILPSFSNDISLPITTFIILDANGVPRLLSVVGNVCFYLPLYVSDKFIDEFLIMTEIH